MSIIEQTTKLLLTQFKGSSIKPAYLEFYTADMKKLDDYATGADARLSALEAEDIALDGRLDTLEGWKTSTVDPALLDYSSRISAIETIIENVSDQNIRDLMERLAALENKVDANTTSIDGLTTRVSDIEDELTGVNGKISIINSTLTSLDRRVDYLEDCCEDVRGDIGAINAELDAHDVLLAGLRSDVDRNADNIQANAEDITILSTQIGTINTNVNALLNDMDVEHIIEFASVKTTSITSKGITFSFTSEGGWCYVSIEGTTTADIEDDETWLEVVPEGFVPAVECYSKAVQPWDITNSLFSISFDEDGDIKSSCSQTIVSGSVVKHTISYPLYQPTD